MNFFKDELRREAPQLIFWFLIRCYIAGFYRDRHKLQTKSS
ncbi:hypothetical protein [Pseudanabaena sp. ABRG5-3]|nr:hypothetical protein [Pseudanabaena sp. ABRG5-3]